MHRCRISDSDISSASVSNANFSGFRFNPAIYEGKLKLKFINSLSTRDFLELEHYCVISTERKVLPMFVNHWERLYTNYGQRRAGRNNPILKMSSNKVFVGIHWMRHLFFWRMLGRDERFSLNRLPVEDLACHASLDHGQRWRSFMLAKLNFHTGCLEIVVLMHEGLESVFWFLS